MQRGEVTRTHGENCFIYTLTQHQIQKYCVSAHFEFDYSQLERFAKKPILCKVKAVPATEEVVASLDYMLEAPRPLPPTPLVREYKSPDTRTADFLIALGHLPDHTSVVKSSPRPPEKHPPEETITRGLDEWYCAAVRSTFANGRLINGRMVYFESPPDLPPEAD